MGLFWKNNETVDDDYGELKIISAELKQNLAELECEEAIMKDKEEYGRVRTNLMKVLRTKHGSIADRALSRVNKRIQEGYFNSKFN